jgi:hypothetical protein
MEYLAVRFAPQFEKHSTKHIAVSKRTQHNINKQTTNSPRNIPQLVAKAEKKKKNYVKNCI